ncbi:ATPase family protein 2 homolog [Folsomia candida]|uniref:Spermatogenesis-associated protein 5 n=1 Tax=Folsomia candida TaxID=158441 RepID=A0A226EVP2_FOLCA|nr:ATPase family protein 2 homolog [Folsomia candida]OXA60666.1 Spermatogenesis-associated protein 5 [Folsomia candida]
MSASGSGKKPGGKTTSGGIGNWFTCAQCGKRLPRSASAKHADADCGDAMYPHILDYGKETASTCALLVNATTTSKIQNLPFIKCCRLSSSTIFIPEELIRESVFETFSWVRVSFIREAGDGDKVDESSPPVAMRVWPIPDSVSSSSVSGNVMMTKDGFLANNVLACTNLAVKIQPLSPRIGRNFPVILPATCVILEIDDVAAEIDQVTFESDRFSQTFKNWFRGRLIATGNQLRIRYYAEVVSFIVKSTTPPRQKESHVEEDMNKLSIRDEEESEQFFEITDKTDVQLELKSGSEQLAKDMEKNIVTLSDVGGLDTIIKELVSTINFIFTSQLNVAKGILLHGHSGTGKTHLIYALCNHFKLTPVLFNEFASVSTKQIGLSAASSNSISKVFQDAIAKSPSAIIIENLDILAPSKSSGDKRSSNFAQSLVSLVPTLSKLKSSTRVVIFASATDIDSVDSGLRSPRIFGKEIDLPVPSRKEREQILRTILSKISHKFSNDEISEIAGATHGFVGADLHGLCTQSVQAAVERNKEASHVKVEMKDMVPCLKSVKPSAIKSILVDVPNVRWNDIGGQTDLKFKLKQAIEWPLKHPEAFQRLGITPPKGVLMYGPPGCSKTMIAKAIATESGLNFISVKGSELFSKWVGESEKAVRDVFRKARQVSPCVVFFDEIDSLGGERGSTSGSSNVHERVLAQLLVELDGIEPLKDVTIVAATNRPDIIDKALLRPGRLDRIIYVPLPDVETRMEILKIRFKKMPVDSDVDIESIVGSTEGYSGAELTALCHEAAMKALEDDITSQKVQNLHFLKALEIVKPRINKDQIQFYEQYSSSHKR